MRRIVSLLLLLSAPVLLAQGEGKAHGPAKRLEALEKKVDGDAASGKLTKPDADELRLKIREAQSMETGKPSLTRKTRQDIHQRIAKIEKDMARMEKVAQALASPAPQ